MALETVLGRAMACGWHPYIAWRVLPRSGRLLLAAGYFCAAYLLTLITLLIAI